MGLLNPAKTNQDLDGHLCQLREATKRPFQTIDISTTQWKICRYGTEYCKSTFRFCDFISLTSNSPVGTGLPRIAWVDRNSLLTIVGRLHMFILLLSSFGCVLEKDTLLLEGLSMHL